MREGGRFRDSVWDEVPAPSLHVRLVAWMFLNRFIFLDVDARTNDWLGEGLCARCCGMGYGMMMSGNVSEVGWWSLSCGSGSAERWQSLK